MITIGICDDDANILSQVETMIKDRFENIEIRTFVEPYELERYMASADEKQIDIMIMDIVFKNDNGIQAAKRVQNRYPKLPLIYLTGYIDYARDIFESDPVYFLVKPIDGNKLYDAVKRAIEKCNKKQYMMVKSRGEVYRVYYDDVVYIESDKKSLHIHTNKATITYINKMSNIENEMPEEFIRIHQSYLVNANYIDSFDAISVKLNIGYELPISRYRGKNIKEKFFKYIGAQV